MSKTDKMSGHHSEGSTAGEVCGECSESTLELKVKTLDSQAYTFYVEKNMPVSLFKEKIANEIGVSVEQQRLIFRGKVLKDDHLLSQYYVENGDTLHLVQRQLKQSQLSADTGSGETSGHNASQTQGNDANSGATHNRVGQISHSVVLGTFNVGDQGEGVVPDLGRVIEAVLNSIGIGSQGTNVDAGGMQSFTSSYTPGQAPLGNERRRIYGDVLGQNQAGNQSQSGQSFAVPQVVQIPLAGGAIPIPPLNAPIADSLCTLTEFMNRMELVLSPIANQPSSTSENRVNPTAVDLPSNSRGLRTAEALAIVLRHAQRLLRDQATAALSHTAERLEQEASSSDPALRTQIQIESTQLGLAMQHLGSLFLELGRTILTLRMGQSDAESAVVAGPAVYISSSGPNPLMVQPFPLQASSLFGGSNTPSNPGPFGVASVPRNVNIHIHAGTSLAPILSGAGNRTNGGDGMQNENGSGNGSVVPARNVVAVAIPTRPTINTAPAPPQSGQSDRTAAQNLSTDARAVSLNGVASESHQTGRNENTRPNSSIHHPGGVPLGLGLGDLQPKRRSRQTKPHINNGEGVDSSVSNQHSATGSQPNLDINTNASAMGASDAQFDPAGVMSQVIRNPALDGFLSGVSQQAGIGSPDVLRGMLEQFSQSPVVRNAVSQIARQVNNQDLNSVFSGGSRSGQDGGIDFSRMVQQMMPMVTQAFSRNSSTEESESQFDNTRTSLARDAELKDFEVDLQQLDQMIHHSNSPTDIFCALVENAIRMYGDGPEDLLHEFCRNENLAHEFGEMLRRDISRRVGWGSGSTDKP